MTALSDPSPSPASAPPPATPSLAPPRNYGRKLLLRTVASLGVGALFVWAMVHAGLPVIPARSAFAHVQWWTVGAYFALYTVVHYFRARRWEYLLRPIATVPPRRIIAIGFVGFFAVLLLPFRMGEFVRPYLIRQKGRISGSAAMGTIAAERVLDGLYVALALAAALLFVPRRPLEGVHIGAFQVARVPQLGYLTVLVFSSALAVLAFFLWKRALAERLTLAVIGVVSPRLAQRLAQIVGGLADGLRSLPDPRLMVPFTIYSAVYWGVNALTMWLLGWGCGLPMGPGHGVAVMGVLAMGILLPAAPGLFGAFQVSVFAALLMYFPREVVDREGAAYVFLMYALQTLYHIVAGVIPLVTEKISVSDTLAHGGDAAESAAPAADEKLAAAAGGGYTRAE